MCFALYTLVTFMFGIYTSFVFKNNFNTFMHFVHNVPCIGQDIVFFKKRPRLPYAFTPSSFDTKVTVTKSNAPAHSTFALILQSISVSPFSSRN